jgi:hypothetical protein
MVLTNPTYKERTLSHMGTYLHALKSMHLPRALYLSKHQVAETFAVHASSAFDCVLLQDQHTQLVNDCNLQTDTHLFCTFALSLQMCQ